MYDYSDDYNSITTLSKKTRSAVSPHRLPQPPSVLRYLFNQKNFLIAGCVICLLLFSGFTFTAVGFNLASAPNVFLNLTQPISLLIFYVLHSWLNLGFLHAVMFLLITFTVSLSMEELASATAVPFGNIKYQANLYDNIMIGNVPLEVPFSYTLLLYPAFVLGEIIVQGSNRTRYRHNGTRKSIYQQCMIPVVASLISLGYHLVIEPIGVNANLWNYVSGLAANESSSSLIYFGVPIFSFLGWYLTSFVIFSLYLLFESILDRFLHHLYQRYVRENIHTGNVLSRCIELSYAFLCPPLFHSHKAYQYINLILPILAVIAFAMPYILIIDPPMLRMIAFFVFFVPPVIALARIR